MIRDHILAHRGLWVEASEKNALGALTAALQQGFGIETDFRDLDGRLVVSHDPPRAATALDARLLFDACARSGGGRLALNVKADGLQTLLIEALSAAGLPQDRAFAFDMSIPDALGYLSQGFPVYTRYSEFENPPSFLDRSAGVWVDDFGGGARQVEAAERMLAAGLRVALVSPELHRRDRAAVWDAIAGAGLHRNPRFELCTDFPLQALERFGTET